MDPRDEWLSVRTEVLAMRAEMTAGFAGVHARLDLMNGRVRKLEVVAENHEGRLTRHTDEWRTEIRPSLDRIAKIETFCAAQHLGAAVSDGGIAIPGTTLRSLAWGTAIVTAAVSAVIWLYEHFVKRP